MYLIGKTGKSKKTLSENIQNFLGGLATQPRPLPGKPRPPRLARFLPVACLLQ